MAKIVSFILTLFPSLLIGEEITLASRVDDVTIYSRSAVVRRVAEIELSKGIHKLAWTNLPSRLIDESVRIEAPDDLHLGDVEIERAFGKKPYSERIVELTKEIERLERVDSSLVDGLDVLKAEQKFIESIQISSPQTISGELWSGKIETTKWDKALKFVSSRLETTKKGMRELVQKKKAIADSLDVLRDKLNEIHGRRPREPKRITVEAEVPHFSQYRLMLSYAVPDAGWIPKYEARAIPDKDTVTLFYYAQANQKTGEDWENVSLTFSTAKPFLGAEAPELTAWYLNLEEPRIAKGEGLSVTARAPHVQEQEDLGQVLEETVRVRPEAEVVSTGISVLLQVIGAKNILSGKELKTLIGSAPLPAEFEYTAVPKLSPHVYLNAKVQNETDYPLLSGAASAFVGSDYVGKSYLANVAPGEEFDLSLGIDPGIEVARELVKKMKSKSGFFGNRERIEYSYRIIIENHRDRNCIINTFDQLPISQNEQIVIKEIEVDPPPLSKDEKGILHWRLEFGPAEKKELILSFFVEYPKGTKIRRL